MKELTREKVVTEITGYQADDGTIFRDREECEKYESTSRAVIKANFEKLVLAENNEYSLFMDYGNGQEDWRIVLIKIKNVDDLAVANMYSQISERRDNRFTTDDIGKELIVGVGDNYGTVDCYVYGTVESLAEKFKRDLKVRLHYEQREDA